MSPRKRGYTINMNVSKQITLEAAKKEFPNEWVLFADLARSPETSETVQGNLIYHSAHRADVYAWAMTLPVPRQIAIFFTGDPPSSATYRLSLYAPERV